jgi:GNAT superfamily N-acetyltransferase
MPGERDDPSPAGSATPAGLEIQPVTPDRWGDMAALFETSPVMSGCWCMSPRLRAKDFSRFGSEARQRNRAAMHGLVAAGTVPGLLAYVEGRPAGWISLGPRAEFARLQRSLASRPAAGQPVWSIVCFFTHPAHRRQGITAALIRAALKYAAAHGAAAVEAYPVAAWGEKMGAGDAYTGLAGTFRALGFAEVGVSGRSRGRPRLIMRYDLHPPGSP